MLCLGMVVSTIGGELPSESSPPNTALNNDTAPGAQGLESAQPEPFSEPSRTLTLAAGTALGLRAFGSRQAHDLALLSLSYGLPVGRDVAREHWFRGEWEIRGELFGGAQFAPSAEWLVGLTPHLRYNFLTNTRWIPFIDAGAGVTATSIGPPDLSNTFEFNLQAGGGVHWFWRKDLALTLECHYLHLSCAGISNPNLGLNSVIGMLGVTRSF